MIDEPWRRSSAGQRHLQRRGGQFRPQMAGIVQEMQNSLFCTGYVLRFPGLPSQHRHEVLEALGPEDRREFLHLARLFDTDE